MSRLGREWERREEQRQLLLKQKACTLQSQFVPVVCDFGVRWLSVAGFIPQCLTQQMCNFSVRQTAIDYYY